VLVVAEGVAAGGAQVAVQAVHGQVHQRQASGGGHFSWPWMAKSPFFFSLAA